MFHRNRIKGVKPHITQQIIHEFIRAFPDVTNEHVMKEKLRSFMETIPSGHMIEKLPDDWLYFQRAKPDSYSTECSVFNRINVEDSLKKIYEITGINFKYVEAGHFIDKYTFTVYLDLAGIIAVLLFVYRFENELYDAAPYIFSMLYDSYLFLEKNTSATSIALSLLFLQVISSGYLASYSDFWLGERFKEECNAYSKAPFTLTVWDKIFGIQLEFCKLMFQDHFDER